MKLTNPTLPYKDKRVRHALMYATDFGALKNDYYRGDAEIQSFKPLQQGVQRHILSPGRNA